MKKLTICIPTYNREVELRRLLDSIIIQIDEKLNSNEIEILVGDNASQDGTLHLLKRFSDEKKFLHFYRNAENMGYAFNINRVISESAGDYCWLMGSDEVLLEGAIEDVMCRLNRSNDIILYDTITNGKLRKLHTPKLNKIYNIHDDDSFAEFLNECTEISGLFAFISSIVIRKKLWDTVSLTEFENSHPYIHMIRILHGIVNNKVTIEYSNKAIVVTGLAQNPYTIQVGLHFLLDHETFCYLKENVIKNPTLIECIDSLFLRQYPKSYLRALKWRFNRNEWSAFMAKFDDNNLVGYNCNYTMVDSYFNFLYFIAKKLLYIR